jgi:hypothetical protein
MDRLNLVVTTKNTILLSENTCFVNDTEELDSG